jgi:hypothetical protein
MHLYVCRGPNADSLTRESSPAAPAIGPHVVDLLKMVTRESFKGNLNIMKDEKQNLLNASADCALLGHPHSAAGSKLL